MSIRLSTDVRGAGRAIRRIKDGIENGAAQGAAVVGEETEEVAKGRIRSVGAIFSGDLIASFDIDIQKRGRNRLRVRIENESDHAAPIEYGAEYTDDGPPVAALIPWVEAKMSGFTIPDDDFQRPSPEELDENLEIPEPDGTVTYLIDAVDDDTLDRAFWLQEHIKDNGIDAVRYMKAAEEWAEESADDTVADAISANLAT